MTYNVQAHSQGWKNGPEMHSTDKNNKSEHLYKIVNNNYNLNNNYAKEIQIHLKNR